MCAKYIQAHPQSQQILYESRAPQPFLTLRNITKQFGATKALDNVSLDFFPGEVHCVLGENGAGKSTVGKIMAGIYAPDSGQIQIRGEPVIFSDVKDSRTHGIAMVFQELSLAPDLSVRANLMLGSNLKSPHFSLLKHKQETLAAERILRRLSCTMDVEEQVQNLPVALQQIVEIAKALLQEPDLIILDEPTAMLGATEKRALFEVLHSLKSEGKSLVMVTHHVEDVMELGDRISVMRNGQLVDSFKNEEGLDADYILERLTGKKQVALKAQNSVKSDAEEVLRIENISYRAGQRGTIRVCRGQIVGFYGVAGCGAESVVQSLVGLLREQGSRFFLMGKPYEPTSPAESLLEGVSYLPAGRARNGIFASLSIRENLSLNMLSQLGKLGVVSQRMENQDVLQKLKQFGVKYHDMEDGIESLSGGNQQKVLMARVMARATNLLVLEEPAAGIDIGAKQSIHERIRELAAQGTAVIVLSSDLLETIQLCQTIYTFYGNEVVRAYEAPSMADQPSIISDVLGQYTTH